MSKYFAVAAAAVMLLFLSSSAIHAGLPDVQVFDGKTLAGWHVLGGADWRVDNGDIVGTVKNGAGGWLVLDGVYGASGLDVSFECKNCQPSVMVRSEKTGDRTSGVNIPLTGSGVGYMHRVTLDGQGNEIDHKPMPPFGEVAPVVGPNYLTTGGCAPVPCAGINGAHGGGGGSPGLLNVATKYELVPGLNKVVMAMGYDVVSGNLNATRFHSAKMEEGAHAYGQIALGVAGPNGAELRIKAIAVQDLTGRKTGLQPEKVSPNFRMQVLNDVFYAEGAAIGDVNHDGINDVVAGPFYFIGPDFKIARELYPPAALPVLGADYPGGPGVSQMAGITHGAYPPSFMSWIQDFNGDGWNDVLMVMSFGPRPTFQGQLFINPKGDHRHWDNYQVVPLITNEASQWVDVDGCGKPELTGQLATQPSWQDAQLGYWKPDWSDPTKPWTFIAISEKGQWSGHGLATGDVNGDGRLDMVSPVGWWEQPPKGTAGLWKYHQARFGNGGAEIFVYDVNGDGLPDIVTSLAAHGVGLSWFEQKKDGTFQEHLIMGAPTGAAIVQSDFGHVHANAKVDMDARKGWEETDKTVAFTELHAMSFVDIDGDGLPDIVTGKRWYSHGYRFDEDDITDPLVLYVFHLKRRAGKVEWVPELIHNRTDAGIQIAVKDIDGDGKPDIVAAGRKGTSIFFNKTPKR